MTPKQWLSCKDPAKMLEYLGVDEHWGYVKQSAHVRVPSRKKHKLDRKLRLFASACCRRIWHLIDIAEVRNAVEVIEQFADGSATKKQLWKACRTVAGHCLELEEITDLELYRTNQALVAVLNASGHPFNPLFAADGAAEAMQEPAAEREAQCRLLRDVIGEPFQALTAVKAPWRRKVADIAATIYDENRFNDLPILADALEEAGCTHGDLLTHCRATTDHVRGCWAVDWILGKR